MNIEKPKAWIVSGLAFVALCLLLFLRRDPGIAPQDDSLVELTAEIDGMTFKLLRDGRAYRVDDGTGRWHYHATVFDPTGMEAAFRSDGTTTFRRDEESGIELPVRRRFREGFEGVQTGRSGLRQLIGPERGWGSLTLQSPSTPTVSDYVKLRESILKGDGEFLDATVMPDSSRSHSGASSLLCKVVPGSADMVTSKASLSTPLVYFRNGDDFWFSGWFFVTSSRPSSLLDLECEWLEHHGGIRVFLDEDGCLLAELKALNKPKYRQAASIKVPFPMNEWVELKVHFHLSADPDEGQTRIWQNRQLLVDSPGVTLPFDRIIYSSLEIGISSHSYGDSESTVWVDDIEVSASTIE